jgi:hypothetical protein
MRESTTTQTTRDGQIVLSSTRADRSRIERDGYWIKFSEDLNSGFTEIVAQNRPELMPPFAEVAVADSAIYALCRLSRPRVVVRYSEDSALVCIQKCDLNARTGLPDLSGAAVTISTPFGKFSMPFFSSISVGRI